MHRGSNGRFISGPHHFRITTDIRPGVGLRRQRARWQIPSSPRHRPRRAVPVRTGH